MDNNYSDNETIPERIYREFVENINSGKLTAGERLPGDRQLAQQYNAGRSSMIAALRMLQQKGYIERLPMRGTFVRKDAQKITSQLKIFCPLPEVEMSPENIGFGSFLVDSEITQGLISNASQDNCSITSQYMEDSSSPLQLRRQLEMIQANSDAVAFIGHQFIHLKELVFQSNIPAVVIFPQYSWGRSHLPSIGYDQETAFAQFAKRLAHEGCKFLGLMNMASPLEADRIDLELRQSMFRKNLAAEGIRVKDYHINYAAMPSEAVYQEIKELLAGETDLPDTFCGPHYPTVIALQQLMHKQDYNFRIVALTGGSIFSLIYPAVTYIRIPCAEMGSLARTTLINAVKQGKPDFADQTVTAKIWPLKQ
jgi:DNA-binding LacI/PurR family transcriptional regulator/DNA-binding transcriptional regulator YhcF (GntR family)